jgi:hypothetical protein
VILSMDTGAREARPADVAHASNERRLLGRHG